MTSGDPQTSPGWGKTFVLSVLLVLIGGFTFWYEFQYQPTKEKSKESENQIFPIRGKAIAKLTLKTSKEVFEFECKDLKNNLCKPTDSSNWLMTKPNSVKADSANVGGLISSMNALTSMENFDLSKETPEKKDALLTEYGLNKNERETAPSITGVTAEGKKWTLYVGATHPIIEGQFAAYEDNLDKVFILPGYFHVNFDRDITYWRDKKLFTFTVSDVESFKLEGPKGKFSAERKDNSWEIKTPELIPGDFENIESLLNAAILAQAKGFEAESKNSAEAKKALSTSAESLKLWIKKEGESEALLLQVYANPATKNNSSKIYATLSNLDPIFVMDDSFLERVNRSVKDVRRVKLITTMERFGTRKIQINDENYINDQGAWKKAKDSTPISSDKVQEMLDKLSGNRIHDFLKQAQPGETDSQFKLALFDESGKLLHRFLFWKSSNNQVFAQPLIDQIPPSETFIMDPAISQSLPFDTHFFQDTVKK